MHSVLPYCGSPPLPGELLSRFNLDPILAAILAALAVAQLLNANSPKARCCAAAGWLIAAIAFLSPLCALSVALFSARVGQHMILRMCLIGVAVIVAWAYLLMRDATRVFAQSARTVG